jgi:hypothetical protein
VLIYEIENGQIIYSAVRFAWKNWGGRNRYTQLNQPSVQDLIMSLLRESQLFPVESNPLCMLHKQEKHCGKRSKFVTRPKVSNNNKINLAAVK